MGRIGVTLLDIEKAALQLQGRGKNPTVDSIREILGTGSKSTIAQHLRAWKTQQPNGQTNLPQDLLALVAGLWERLNTQAEQRIFEIESASNQQSQESKHALRQIQQDYTQLKNQLHQLEELYVTEQQTKKIAQEKLLHAEQEHAKLIERHNAMSQQLEDYKTENARLHQLASNIQANLEHYQNAMQQLRTDQTLAMDKLQIQSQQEISILKQQLSVHNQQVQELNSQLQQKNSELMQLDKQYRTLHQNHEKSVQQLQETFPNLILLKERCEQQQKTIGLQEETLKKKTSIFQEQETKVAILTSQAQELRSTLKQAEIKIDNLRQEKLVIVQEKAQLEGYFKQMDAIKKVKPLSQD